MNIIRFARASIVALVLFGATAQAAGYRFPNKSVTMQMKNTGVRQALESLLQTDSRIKYSLTEEVTNKQKVAIDVKDAKIVDVFEFLMIEGSLQYQVVNGVLVIGE